MSQGPAAPGFGFVSVPVDDASDPLAIGCPVYVTSSGTLLAAEANVDTIDATIGLAIKGGRAGDNAEVQYAGAVALGVDQWNNLITGASDGLVPGDRYYVSSTQAGKLVTTAPSAGGTFQLQVGVALSANILLLSITGPVVIH